MYIYISWICIHIYIYISNKQSIVPKYIMLYIYIHHIIHIHTYIYIFWHLIWHLKDSELARYKAAIFCLMEHCKGDLLSLQTYWVFCAYRTLSEQFVWLKHTLCWCLRDVYSINIHEHPLTIPHWSPLTEFNGHVMVPTTANCRVNWDLCLANLDSPVIEPSRQIYARWRQSLMCIMYIYGYICIYI